MRVIKNFFLFIFSLVLFPLWVYFLMLICTVFYFGAIPPDILNFISTGFSYIPGISDIPFLTHFLFLPGVLFVVMLIFCFIAGRLKSLLKVNSIVLLISGFILAAASAIMQYVVDTTMIDREVTGLAASVPKNFSGTPAEIANGAFNTGIIAGISVIVISVIMLIIASKIGKEKKPATLVRPEKKPDSKIVEKPAVHINKISEEKPEVKSINKISEKKLMAVTISEEKPETPIIETPAPAPEPVKKEATPPEKEKKTLASHPPDVKKLLAPGMRIIAGIVAAIIAYNITFSWFFSVWAFIFPVLTFLLEKPLDVIINRITPWKRTIHKAFLFIIGILVPSLFSFLVTLLLNIFGLGYISAALLIIIVPPFAYLIARKPPVKEASA